MKRGNVTAITTPLFPSVIDPARAMVPPCYCDFKLAHATAALSRRGCERFITRWNGAALTARVPPDPHPAGYWPEGGICIISDIRQSER